jgi:hypothetical protein
VRQYRAENPDFTLFKPDPVVLLNGGSELNGSSPNFSGAHPTRGVNPATGVVLYYYLPELKEGEELTLEILDAQGKWVRSFSSKADDSFEPWDGGPDAEPTLPKAKGLNRFVWNLRYPTMAGVPGTYVESSFAGHKASPGKYTATLKMGGKAVVTEVELLPNPAYPTDAKTYQEYHELMSSMEKELTGMHQLINSLYGKREQLEQVLGTLDPAKHGDLKKEGQSLVDRMRQWDEDMIQRKSKAYDDVENFPNKFTANYMFLINQTESDIPRVNQPNLDRLKELRAQWAPLEQTAHQLLHNQLPAFNKKLWEAGVGAVWKK